MSTRRRSLIAILAAILLSTGVTLSLSSPVAATGGSGQVCSGLDSGKIDTTGDPASVTVTAPDGKLIDGYCVKAGSASQGNGPVYVDVDPPKESVTITYPGGKAISHYSVSYTNIVPPPPTDACPDMEGNQPPGTDCTPPPTDACELIPGNQPPGTDCTPPPTDACELIPGNQPKGTDCTPPPTDACELIPGNQPKGTDCTPSKVTPPKEKPPVVKLPVTPPKTVAPPTVVSPPTRTFVPPSTGGGVWPTDVSAQNSSLSSQLSKPLVLAGIAMLLVAGFTPRRRKSKI